MTAQGGTGERVILDRVTGRVIGVEANPAQKPPYRLVEQHEDWCPAKNHADCCGGDCECLRAEWMAAIDRVTWANEEWSEEYRQGYNKALSRLWASVGADSAARPPAPSAQTQPEE